MPAIFDKHLKAIKAEFGDHPNIELVCKVLEICASIHALDDYGKFNGSAFLTIARFRGCLDRLAAIPDSAVRKGVMRFFLDQINYGAMSDLIQMKSILREIELWNVTTWSTETTITTIKSAISFCCEKANQALYASSFDALMEEFDTKYNGNLSMPAVFEFFADKVESQLVVRDSAGNVKPLTWWMISKYLKYTFEDAPIDKDWLLHYRHIVQPSDIHRWINNKWYIFHFNEEKPAKHYLSYIRSVLPEHAAELAKASVKYDEKNKVWQFKLTPVQFFKFNQLLFANDIVGPPQAERCALAKQEVLIKSIRWDNDCFIEEFLDDATRDPSQDESVQDEPKLRPRPAPHRKYTVRGDGVIKRSEKKPSTYGITDQEELKRKKAERSPPQSTTLVTPDKQSAVFGYGTPRQQKLAGFIFDAADALVKLLLLYDRGTIDRPYEFDDENAAEWFFEHKVKGKFPFMFADVKKFKKAIKSGELNEVIARLRWLAESSAVAVFSVTFEARCVAQYYARLVRMKTKKPDDYQVPIVNYLPYDTEKHWTYYTEEQQCQDRLEAENIMADEERLEEALSNNNFEFLLILADPLSALRTTIEDKTIFEWLKEKKEYHLMHALLKIILSSSEDKTLDLKDLKIDYPTMAYFIKRGDKKVVKYCFAHSLFHIKRKDIPQDPKNNLLLLACKRGWDDVTQGLVRSSIEYDIKELGIHVNEKNSWAWPLYLYRAWDGVDQSTVGETPLMSAVMARRPNVVKALLNDESLDPNTTKLICGSTPLLVAVELGDIEMTTLLLDDERVDYTDRNNRGYHALNLALLSENCALIAAILNHKRVNERVSYDADSWYRTHSAGYNPIAGLVKDARSTKNLDVYLTVARVLVQSYIKKLEQRTEEYAPRGGFVATLFGCAGFSKNEKLAAARRFLQLLNGESVTLTGLQRAALKNGTLSNIVEALIYTPPKASPILDFIVNLRKQIDENPPASVEEEQLLQNREKPNLL